MWSKFISNTFPLYWELVLFFMAINLGIYNPRWMLVAFALNAATILFGSFKLAFSQLFFLLPYTMIYKLSPDSSSFFAYAIILMSFVSIAKTFNKSASANILIILYTLYLFTGLTSKWSLVVKAIGGLFCLVYFVTEVSLKDLMDIILSSALGILGASYMGLSKMTNPYIERFFSDFNSEYMNGEQIFRFSGLMPDPNYYSVSVIVAVFMLARLLQSKVLNKYLGGLLIFALVWFGALSYSRVYFLSLFLVILYYVHIYTGRSKYGVLSLIVVASCFIVGWWYLTQTSYYLNAVARFEVEDVSSGRTTIWARYLSTILDDIKILLLGSGYDSSLVGKMGAHNTYIEALYHLGVVGLTLFISIFYTIFHIRGPIGKDWNRYVLLFIFCIMIGTLGFYKQNDFPFYLMMVWVSMYFSPSDFQMAYASNKKKRK